MAELHPGMTFDFEGQKKRVMYTGTTRDPADPTKIKLALRINPGRLDEALHILADPLDVKIHGRNFWIASEKLTEQELKRQYISQGEIFKRTGITQILSSGETGIVGEDGKEYPMPTLDKIRQHIFEQGELFGHKIKQGFTKLQLTPFALPIPILAEQVGAAIKKHTKEGNIFQAIESTTGRNYPETVNVEDPLYRWNEWFTGGPRENVLYFPTYFPTTFRDKKDHEGLKKADIISAKNLCAVPGWSIGLIDPTTLPVAAGKGKVIEGRNQLENNHSPKEYLQILQGAAYVGESGWTIEDFFTDFLIRLEETNQVSHDFGGGGYGENGVCLTGNFSPWQHNSNGQDLQGVLPGAGWNRGAGKLSARTLNPGSEQSPWHMVTMVRIGSKDT